MIRARRPVSLLFAVLLLASAAPGCPPRPPASLDGSVTPSAWTDTARVVLDTLAWAIPAAKLVVAAVVPEPARTIVCRTLDAVSDYASRLASALDTYQARGGDRCAAYAAAGGLSSALVSAARVLADNGLAIGRPLEGVLDSVSALVDTLVPACQADAGFASAGASAHDQLQAITDVARARGVTLRRDLDAIRPPAH